jgi:hypothetical protein
VDVNVIELPFADLHQIAGLQIFDPASKPIIQDAKKAARDPETDATKGKVRDRARFYDELAARTEAHGLTGSARSAIEWAGHRLHHRRVRSKRLEAAVRFSHRLVGYGYRPGPAIVTLLSLCLVVSMWSLPSDCNVDVTEHGSSSAVAQYCVHDTQGTQWSDWPRAYVSIVVAPAKLIRVTDSTSPLPYFPAPIDTAVNVIIGLTALFTVLALRNFFRINPLD